MYNLDHKSWKILQSVITTEEISFEPDFWYTLEARYTGTQRHCILNSSFSAVLHRFI